MIRAIPFIIFISFTSCRNEHSGLPKPRIYPRVEYPIKTYVVLDNEECPFTMLVPSYSDYEKDTLKNKYEQKFSCWFDLHTSSLNAYMHFSYVPFENRTRFDELVKDAFEMADKHNIRAKYRDEFPLSYPEKRLYGLLFEIDGPVASPIQFYLTDSTQHFLRGSLYFNDIVNRDSIQPVYEFLKEDLEPMFGSFEWRY